MASFRRKTPAGASSLRSGTKPFLNGQTLVSSGLSELDAALGGGLLLGTLTVVETPAAASDVDVGAGASEALAIDLLRYFAAEGVADGKQRVAIVAPDAGDFVREQLPLELSLAQRQVKQQLADSERKTNVDAPLTIAWQYGKYEHQQQQRQPQRQRFCHSYDLSKAMHREMVAANEPVAIDPLTWMTEGEAPVGDVYERLYVAIEELVQRQKEDGEGQVLRVGMLGLGSPLLGAPDAAHMLALFSFFRRLRALLGQSKGAVCLALLGSDALSAFPAAFINELRHTGDSVLTLSAFAGTRDLLPEELLEFQGSLTLRKLPRVHALACHAPSNTRFGVKRERRKLKIEKFHLPPEGSRSSSSNSSGCGSNTSTNGPDPLAF
ncbi:Elongator complex protein [Phytophthora cinnamomi]|uniref:Elongator complex protein n=1 Tax=Phytophthora cinnamomi TaxID=4785 RepID=UPI00355A57AB|nr:Elongator complex protein [Phytophthora cinnamomi]